MATTVTNPNYWTLTLTSNTASTFNFKFVVDITIGGVLVARIKQPKNMASAAHISYEKIVKNYITISHKHKNTIVGTQYDSIHLMPQNAPNPTGTTLNDYIASYNSGDLRTVLLEFHEEYASTEGGAITLHLNEATAQTKAIINYANSWEDLKTFDLAKYNFDSASTPSKFLTERPTATTRQNELKGKIAQLTSANDYQTMAMFNERSTYFNTENGRFLYKFYESVPTTLSTYDNHVGIISVQNSYKAGVEAPNLSNSEDEYLIYLACGGANVMNMDYAQYGGYKPTAAIKYYSLQYISTVSISETSRLPNEIIAGEFVEITATGTADFTSIGAASNTEGVTFYATGSTTGTGQVDALEYEKLSEPYLFEMVSDANGNSSLYEGKNIAWKNKLGVWDYYFFDGAFTDKESYKRKTQRENIAGSWNAATFELNSYERGKVDKVEGIKQTTVNTRYISDEWNVYLKGLLMSNEVQIIEGGKSYPINIKNGSFDVKTNLKDKLVQYSFTYEYAHDLKERV
tara:strand:- start:189 stop:1739 length:1551 start_codon:yes stop_codon:yes gene_type:complete